MKRKHIVFVFLFTLVMALLPACDLLEECGSCRMITEDATGIIDEGTPLPFCGEDLQDKKNAPPVTVGGLTTYWRCD
jgi:hypothetical protein